MVTCIIIKNAIYVGKNVLRHILPSLCHIAWNWPLVERGTREREFATRNLDSGIRKILALFHLESWPRNPEYKSRNLESCVRLEF